MRRRRFEVLDEVVEIQAPRDLGEIVDALYADARTTSVTPTIRLSLGATGNGWMLTTDGQAESEETLTEGIRGPDGLYEVLQRELTYALLKRLAPRYLLMHAGAVRWGGIAVLLPGNHDSGKSSLALELGKTGSFYSDDVTPIDPNTLCAERFVRELVLHGGTRAGQPGLARPVACARFEAYDYLSAGLAGLSWAAPAPVGALVFPHRNSGSAAQLTPVTQAESARRLLEQCFDLERLGVISADTVSRLAQCPAVDVWFDQANQIAPLVHRWLQDMALPQRAAEIATAR